MKLKTLILVAAFGLAGTVVFAQNSEKKWGAGVQLGFMQYSGDYASSLFAPSSGIAPGLLVSRYLNPSLDIMLEASFVKMQGDDHGKRNRTNNLHFDATMVSANVLLKYKFDNGYILETSSKWAPYVVLGAGLLNSSSEGFGYGEGTAPAFTSDVTAFNVCGGIGLTFKLSSKLNLFLQSCAWFPFNDQIDGWSVEIAANERNDAFLKTSLGVVFNFGGKGSEE